MQTTSDIGVCSLLGKFTYCIMSSVRGEGGVSPMLTTDDMGEGESPMMMSSFNPSG